MDKYTIDPNTFEPNENYRTLFPWASVFLCLDRTLPPSDFKGCHACPKCNTPSESLVWIKFYDLQDMWKGVDNHQGAMSICKSCKIQVQFIDE